METESGNKPQRRYVTIAEETGLALGEGDSFNNDDDGNDGGMN